MATGLEQTAVNPHNLQSGQVRRSVGGLAATALDPLRRAYQAYQQYVGQPFQQAVRGGVRGYFGLPMMTDADAMGREAYRQAEALGYTPGVGMPAGAVRLAAEGVQALPSIAGDIGRLIAGMPSGAGAAQAEDFARYQRSIPPSDVSPLTAFHGTPHRFEPTPANPLGEFRAAKIGSGEGAQAYGYGTYFAESPEVAGSYRKALTFDGFKIKMKDGSTQIAARTTTDGFDPGAFLVKHNGNYDDAIKDAESRLGSSSIVRQLKNWKENSVNTSGFGNKGSLYTVDIPDSMVEKMLDWDKPLSQQPENVKKAFAKVGVTNDLLTGGQAYRAAHENAIRLGKPKPAAEKEVEMVSSLRKAGLPGIRYLDAGSRGSADGTRNIVVFPGEESKVKILKRE